MASELCPVMMVTAVLEASSSIPSRGRVLIVPSEYTSLEGFCQPIYSSPLYGAFCRWLQGRRIIVN